MNQYIVDSFIMNDLESMNLSKSKELFVILNRIKKSYILFNNNMNEMNTYLYTKTQLNEYILKILNNTKENIKNQEKEYNKIMNEIYKFNVDS